MRGLDHLQQIRRAGLKPQSPVMFNTDPEGRAFSGWVVADASDRPGLADLRAFIGLSVIVTGGGIEAVDPWAQALCQVGADSVAVCIELEPGRVDGPVFLKFKGEVLA